MRAFEINDYQTINLDSVVMIEWDEDKEKGVVHFSSAITADVNKEQFAAIRAAMKTANQGGPF